MYLMYLFSQLNSRQGRRRRHSSRCRGDDWTETATNDSWHSSGSSEGTQTSRHGSAVSAALACHGCCLRGQQPRCVQIDRPVRHSRYASSMPLYFWQSRFRQIRPVPRTE